MNTSFSEEYNTMARPCIKNETPNADISSRFVATTAVSDHATHLEHEYNQDFIKCESFLEIKEEFIKNDMNNKKINSFEEVYIKTEQKDEIEESNTNEFNRLEYSDHVTDSSFTVTRLKMEQPSSLDSSNANEFNRLEYSSHVTDNSFTVTRLKVGQPTSLDSSQEINSFKDNRIMYGTY